MNQFHPERLYLLRGTSDYGTTYETTKVSDRKGEFSFTEIEKGTYEILETACTNDWLLKIQRSIL